MLMIAAAACTGCRPVLNYPSALGPRYVGVAPARPDSAPGPHALRVVTYNVQFGRHIDRAINVLSTRAPLPGADIIVLQEMDAEGTRRIAEALGMSWIYYPAVVHPKAARQDFGNAILSRWPIVADEKLMLPHIAGQRHAQRIATAATVHDDRVQLGPHFPEGFQRRDARWCEGDRSSEGYAWHKRSRPRVGRGAACHRPAGPLILGETHRIRR